MLPHDDTIVALNEAELQPLGTPVPVAAQVSDERRIALLRGINVGGHNRLPMQELRGLCEDLGLANPRTYIQSGNLVFESERKVADLETMLEVALLDRFGITQAVIVRTPTDWRKYLQGNPFPDSSRAQPKLVMLALSKDPPDPRAADELTRRATAGEQALFGAGAIWLHFPDGSGRSRLSPGLIDRIAGSPTTTRNWLTVQKIGEMVDLTLPV